MLKAESRIAVAGATIKIAAYISRAEDPASQRDPSPGTESRFGRDRSAEHQAASAILAAG